MENTNNDLFLLLAKMLRGNKLVFFLGAGASLHTDPSTQDTARGRRRLPTGAELTQELAALVKQWLPPGAPPRLMEVASYLQIMVGRFDLATQLTRIFDVPYAPGQIHRFLAGLGDSILIVTTNYDRFIERAFDDVGRKYHLIVNTLGRRDPWTVPKALWFPPGQKDPERWDARTVLEIDHPIIFKIHGSIGLPDRFLDTFVITEEDYYEMAGRQYKQELVPIPHL